MGFVPLRQRRATLLWPFEVALVGSAELFNTTNVRDHHKKGDRSGNDIAPHEASHEVATAYSPMR